MRVWGRVRACACVWVCACVSMCDLCINLYSCHVYVFKIVIFLKDMYMHLKNMHSIHIIIFISI